MPSYVTMAFAGMYAPIAPNPLVTCRRIEKSLADKELLRLSAVLISCVALEVPQSFAPGNEKQAAPAVFAVRSSSSGKSRTTKAVVYDLCYTPPRRFSRVLQVEGPL